jgi:hypothetical protein
MSGIEGIKRSEDSPYTSRLALTAEDHSKMGSSGIDQILLDNPGKTMGELMSDQGLLDYLKRHQQEIEKLSKPEFANDTFSQSMLEWRKEDLPASIEYLSSINRLPKEFTKKD